MGIKRREFLASVGSAAGLAGLGSIPVVATAATAAARAGQGGMPLYKQAGAPIEARVNDLLGRMTLEEKIAQMQCLWQKKPDVQNPDSSFSGEKAIAAYPNGMGMFARPSDRLLGNTANVAGNAGETVNRGPRETAEYVNAVQKWALERTRLGIPVLMHEEALHGYTAREATSFPQAIGLASSFDPALVTRVFSVA
ncbi:MAG: glycoside hydrolase family 3 N-terminal domain-containing protein, partial [Telluria sp.]